jgi:hypothetical protein
MPRRQRLFPVSRFLLVSTFLLMGAVGLLPACARAALYRFTASLSLSVDATQGLVFEGSGNGLSGLSGVQLPASLFSGTKTAPASAGALSAFAASLVPNGPGVFSGTPLEGTMPIFGGVRFLAFGTTVATVPLQPISGPGAFGVGGMVDTPHSPPQPGISFAPWDVGPVTVSGPGGSQAMFTGADSRTPGGLGQIALVSPARITSAGGGDVAFLLVGTLRLQFVPEPTTPLLLVVGSALLAGLGHRRARRPRGDS